MDTKKKSIVVLSVWTILFFSCTKKTTIPLNETNSPDSFLEVFDLFWNKMSINYGFWDIEKTEWDKVYITYRPLFDRLNLDNKEDVERSELYFREMTKNLIDGHFQIHFKDSYLNLRSIYPSLERKIADSSFHHAYSYTEIDKSYFTSERLTGDFVTSGNQRLSLFCGLFDKNILYFSFNRFSLQEAYLSKTDNGAKKVLDYFFEVISTQRHSIKGIIIDVRNNIGGSVSDLAFLYGKLINDPIQFGYSRSRVGLNRFSYTPWTPSIISPAVSANANLCPVITLTDNYSMSLAETFAMVTAADPNGIVIGETTWGATGALADNQLFSSGSFNVFDFMEVTCTSVTFKYKNGERYEGQGFPPDISVPFNLDAIRAGHDLQVEKAIERLRH